MGYRKICRDLQGAVGLMRPGGKGDSSGRGQSFLLQEVHGAGDHHPHSSKAHCVPSPAQTHKETTAAQKNT